MADSEDVVAAHAGGVDPDRAPAGVGGAQVATAGRRRWRPSEPISAADRLAVSGLMVLGAAGVIVVRHEPTPLPLWNVLLTGATCALVIGLASRSRRWSWLVVSGVSAVVADEVATLLLGVVALVFSLRAAWRPVRQRWAGALVAACSLQALARIPDLGPERLPTVVAAVAVGPLIYTGYQRVTPGVRRRLVRVGFATTFFTVAAGGLALVGIALHRNSVGDGVAAAREAITAASDGDQELVAERLDEAGSAFGSASAYFSGPLGWPARLVPVLGHNVDAVATVADRGEAVAAAGAGAARQVELEDVVGEPGRIDLARVASFAGPIGTINESIESTRDAVGSVNRVWVHPELDAGIDDLVDRIDEAGPGLETVQLGIRTAPELLGADGPARYLVLFSDPGEARELGGFIPIFTVLEADDGELSVGDAVAARLIFGDELRDPLASLPDSESFPVAYNDYRPAAQPQNITATPDLPTVARAVRLLSPEFRPELLQGDLAGVIYLDPYVIERLLGFTGPIEVAGLDEPIDQTNVVDYLLEKQYLIFSEDEQQVERREVLADLLESAFTALVSREIPAPRALADALAAVSREERLLIHSFEPLHNQLFTRMGVDGTFPAPLGRDLLAVSHSNKAVNKMDIYIERAVEYDVAFDPVSGAVAGTVTVTLENRVPQQDLPDYLDGNIFDNLPERHHRVDLQIHSPHTLQSAWVGSTEVLVQSTREHGVNRFATLVDVSPDRPTVVRFELSGFIDPRESYGLQLVRQPVVLADDLTLRITHSTGWRWAAGDAVEGDRTEVVQGTLVHEQEISSDELLVFPLERG